MDITSVSSLLSKNNLSVGTNKTSDPIGDNRNATFETMFQSALKLVNETNAYSNAAQQEEMAYAAGLTNSTHDLQIAQTKASISLQYTVAVRNAVLEAYKEIMQLQF